MRNVILFGCFGSGKDTVAMMLKDMYDNDPRKNDTPYEGTRCIIEKLGTSIREVGALLGRDNMTRTQLQGVGQGLRAIFDSDIWNDTVWDRIKHRPSNVPVIIADGRQENEMVYWEELAFVPVGVAAPEHQRINRAMLRDGVEQSTHITHQTEIEAMAQVYGCDFILNNNGTEQELRNEVKKLYDYLTGGMYDGS